MTLFLTPDGSDRRKYCFFRGREVVVDGMRRWQLGVVGEQRKPRLSEKSLNSGLARFSGAFFFEIPIRSKEAVQSCQMKVTLTCIWYAGQKNEKNGSRKTEKNGKTEKRV
jgi:hypothetical protein